MSNLLRIAAAVCLGWAVVLLFAKPVVLPQLAPEAIGTSVAHGLAILHLGWAFILWRAAADPTRDRTVVYGTLLVLGLRAIKSTYESLYVLEGTVAVAALVDMVTSLALFVGIINALPGQQRGGGASSAP